MALPKLTTPVLYVFIVILLDTIFCKHVEVRSSLGTIVGQTRVVTTDKENKEIEEYLGIPYAKPPIGNLRFRKPERYGPFKSAFNASTFGDMCPQGGLKLVPLHQYNISEDCLTLNIFKPRGAPKESSKFAVMIYIHGGAFITGSSTFYVSDVLSAYGDILVVTLNYRLSIFGFLTTNDEYARGNYGLWDQRLAIQWVHDNVAAFQGDPNRVALFGQSAGAISVLYQAMFPANKGLFQRIIAESGTPVNFGSINVGPSLNHVNYKTVGNMIGCSYLSSVEVLDCLRKKSTESIMSALEMSFYQIPFSPVFDGEFILEDPQTMLNRTNTQYRSVQDVFSSVEMIIGGNNMEGAIYLSFLWKALLLSPNMEQFRVTSSQFKERIIPNVLKQIYGHAVSEHLVSAVFMRYSDITKPYDNSRLRDMLLRLSTDYVFKIPNLHTANLHSGLNGKTFVYEFNAKSRMSIGKFKTPSWVDGANHGDDTAFVFGFSRRLLDALNISRNFTPTQEEVHLSRYIMLLWRNFAKFGYPSDESDWPMFTAEYAQYLELSTNQTAIGVQNNYGQPTGEFWLELMPYLIGHSNNSVSCTKAVHGVEEAVDMSTGARVVIAVLSVITLLLIVALVTQLCLNNKKKKQNFTYDTVEM